MKDEKLFLEVYEGMIRAMDKLDFVPVEATAAEGWVWHDEDEAEVSLYSADGKCWSDKCRNYHPEFDVLIPAFEKAVKEKFGLEVKHI